MSVFFGPAGWSYPDWKGTVYPARLPAGFHPLVFLAERFDFVEVNTTFYHIPAAKLPQGWVEKTAHLPHFRFWVKIHQSFTHERSAGEWAARQFLAALQPLIEAGKLAGLLAQFPYSFKCTSGNLSLVRNTAELFQPWPLAVEFRHRGWESEKVLEILRSDNLIWTNIDQPVISHSLPLTAHLTHADTAYVRLHGRNAAEWFADNGRDARYNYNYSAAELHDIAAVIRKLQETAKKIFVAGNNHYKGNAIQNLLQLKKIIQQEEAGG